jgi:hypothetical protein
MVRDAPFSLGKFGYFIVSLSPPDAQEHALTSQNILTVIWIIFSIVLFCMRESSPLKSRSWLTQQQPPSRSLLPP